MLGGERRAYRRDDPLLVGVDFGTTHIRALVASPDGTVVTIGSARENRFVHDMFIGDGRFTKKDANGGMHGPRIGLYQIDRSREPRGGWTWTTGEPLTYTNWSKGNPDNFSKRQHWATCYRPKSAGRGTSMLWWDDTSDYATSYIIEIE